MSSLPQTVDPQPLVLAERADTRANSRTNAASAETSETFPAPRGRFLARYNARVIEDGNVTVVEFVDRPWFTDAARRRIQRRGRLAGLLAALHLL